MQSTEVKGKRAKTAAEALSSLMRLCARAEKSSGDAERLMRSWGVTESDRTQVLERLLRDRFIDDSRYANAFVREKLRLSGWGEYKIRMALQRKGIAKELIGASLAQTSSADMANRLRTQLQRKIRTVKYTTPYELKTKLIRYGISLGYDFETVVETVAGFVKETDICNDF